jgi:N-acetylmuramoyl-L-alanine amidase
MIASRAVRRSFFALAFATLVPSAACSAKGGNQGTDAGADGDFARATAMTDAGAPLPTRPEAMALAQSIEAKAVREGAGPRAVELHALAAALVERAWRVEHREQDAKEAVDMYRSASRDLAVRGACEAAVRGAKLTGEAAGDAQTTYAELYRIQKRGGAGADAGTGLCAAAVDPVLAELEPFRPPSQVLDAIDRGLAGEGAIALATADAGAARVVVAPKVTRIEQWTGQDAARIVVHVDRQARFRVGDEPSAAGKGARTYVDLDGVTIEGPARSTALGGIVTRIVTEPTSTGSRVSLDLAGPAYRRVFHLLEPYRVVIDIAKQPPGGSANAKSRDVTRVAIDPGHGGNDPGASGPTGLKEKDVTLAIAHKVAPMLTRLNIQVALTRDDDRYVTLEERTARANAFGADLFVSIHCNAAEKSGRRGIETYVLDTTNSEMSGRVAARENGASTAASNEVAQLLASMRLADQGTRSTKLAELLERAAVAGLTPQYPDVVGGGVHRAGFYVLVGARMPAVLFETSYISNTIDEQRLGSEDYQQRLADAVTNAIKAYKEGR